MSARPRLLIVEDEADLREILAEMLSPLMADITMAENGRIALQAIEASLDGTLAPITAILSDVNMPKMTGLQLLSEVRQLALETPFIVLTAFSDKANTLQALRLGANDFLEKPFDRATLLKVVANAIEVGSLMHELEKKLLQLDDQAKIRERESLIRRKSLLRIRFKG